MSGPRKSSEYIMRVSRWIAGGFEGRYEIRGKSERFVRDSALEMARDIVEDMSPEEQLDAWYAHQDVHQPDDIAIEFNVLEPSDPTIARDLLIDQYWHMAFSIGMHLSKKAKEKGSD